MKKKAFIFVATMFAALPAMASEGLDGASAYIAIGAAIAIGVAAFGGAIAQGKIGAAAMDGIARNPQARKEMFVPMIIGLALVESLVIYALLIGLNLSGQVEAIVKASLGQ